MEYYDFSIEHKFNVLIEDISFEIFIYVTLTRNKSFFFN